MKTIFMTMAAVSALALTAPASAQSWNSHQTHSAELRMQIDAGVESGAISRREMAPLRDSLRQLVALERQFSANGISGREHASLQQRSATLRRQITLAARSGPARTEYDGRGGDERRAAWEDRYDREHRADWEARYTTERLAAWESRFGRDQRSNSNARFDRPNRGDRFAGDARVGQRYPARMVNLPAEYIIDYRNNDQVYYGFDEGRIYQIDRRTGLILGLLDLPN